MSLYFCFFFFFQAEDGIRDLTVTGVQTCALPISPGDHGVDGAPEGPWSALAVDEPPVLLAGPPLGYPDVLRRTGTTGTVTVQLVIDTLGRAEPGSLVLQSSHPGFEGAARAYVLGALFRPGRTHGRAVRVLVRLPISFTLRPPR